MVRQFILWNLKSPAIVLLAVAALTLLGGYAFISVNVEAYPDPAPAIIEVVAQYPGASAEEVERRVTVPLEIALAGMQGLKTTRSKSLFGLAHLRSQFDYGVDYNVARQEVINRLSGVDLPDDVLPELSPASPIGEIFRYVLASPQDAAGRDIYTLHDLKAFQDWILEREFRRIPRVAGVVSAGGVVKRYEIQPDPDRLQQFGVTLEELQQAIAHSNANVGGDCVVRGPTMRVVRGIGLIGGGEDPFLKALRATDAQQAADILRDEEERRIRELRSIVVAAVNGVPIRVDQLVDGGPFIDEHLNNPQAVATKGVLVSYHTRQGILGTSLPANLTTHSHAAGNDRPLIDRPDRVQGIILLRKGEKSLPALEAVSAKIDELNNNSGKMLPGVQIVPFYNRASLIDVTTETVHENLVVGLTLVTLILLMFLGNVRTALIVACNIPLALMFAFLMLYVRGKSANLLSIGAVDFGIIVDSSVIMVENIYRRVATSEIQTASLRERIAFAASEVQKSLFFSTLIMICALLPLFTMTGPEGQIFGPMADTYAFALGGALLLAVLVSPVLCVFFFRNLKPARDNLLVRFIKTLYMKNLDWTLRFRYGMVAVFALLLLGTAATLPFLGREFMPELEEGNLVVRGTFPVDIALEETAEQAALVRSIIGSFPEVKMVTSQVGRPDDGTDPTGFYNMECFVPLRQPAQWPVIASFGRPRSKAELIQHMSHELECSVPGVDWDFSQIIRDNVMEALSGVKGENSIKIFGPDLNELEELAAEYCRRLSRVAGVRDTGVFRINGQSNLTFPVDRDKCASWGVRVDDVQSVIQAAVGGKRLSDMQEGEKRFDITLRWPQHLRENDDDILNIPVDVVRNRFHGGTENEVASTTLAGGSTGLRLTGTRQSMPALTGNAFNATYMDLSQAPRRRLRDLVTAANSSAVSTTSESWVQEGASTIYREQGQRFIAVKFSVRERDLAGTVADAKAVTQDILPAGYSANWSGEFQQMQEAERRMAGMVLVALSLILVMLYLAFRSWLDAIVVYANVAAMSVGGVWTLIVTGTNFNISAAVGFISILGVAVMNGLLMISAFNSMRAQGVAVRDAIRSGVEHLVCPIVMTALAALLGLLPAALSTRIGSQAQRPLAMVVVGGMIATLMFINLIPLLYSFYGHREPPEGSSSMAH